MRLTCNKFCNTEVCFKILSTELNHIMFVNTGLKKHLAKETLEYKLLSYCLLQGSYMVVDATAYVRQMFTESG